MLDSLVYTALSFPVPQEGTVMRDFCQFVTENLSALFWSFQSWFLAGNQSYYSCCFRLTPVSYFPDCQLQERSLSASQWPVGGATWQHIKRRRGGTRLKNMYHLTLSALHTDTHTPHSLQHIINLISSFAALVRAYLVWMRRSVRSQPVRHGNSNLRSFKIKAKGITKQEL